MKKYIYIYCPTDNYRRRRIVVTLRVYAVRDQGRNCFICRRRRVITDGVIAHSVYTAVHIRV